MKVLFLDTNILLHCKDLRELPWKNIQPEDSLLLLIPKPVQKEIDRLKSDGNSKRAKKARNASKVLREIVFSEDSKTCIRSSNPSVDISIVPKLKGAKEIPDILDMSSADDQILVEMIAYIEKHSDDEVALLTQDINLLVTAKNLDLPFIQIPDDWLLPVESDPKDKKILELEKRLKGLENTNPEIEIEAKNDMFDDIKFLPIDLLDYQDLEIHELEELVESIKSKNPVQTNFDDENARELARLDTASSKHLGLSYHYQSPSKEEIERYQNEEYPNWLKRVEDYINSLPYNLGFPSRSAKVSFSINNCGSVPVEDIVVEFKLFGGLLFKPPNFTNSLVKKEDIDKLLQPPKPPQFRIIKKDESSLAISEDSFSKIAQQYSDRFKLPDYSTLFNPEDLIPRDKNTFYWKDEEPPLDYSYNVAFECDEFLHHVSPQTFYLSVFVPMEKQDGDKFNIQCRVVGKNIPKPVVFILSGTVTIKSCDSFEEVKNLILM